MNSIEKPHDAVAVPVSSQAMIADFSSKSTLCFGLLLLLFIQTLTVWLESIYKVGLTRLAMGPEMAGLLFVLAPLLGLFCPGQAQRTALWISVSLFLIARALLPYAGATSGLLLAGAGVGAFLVALCAMFSRQFRFLCGDPGVALGLAVLSSIALRAWGATYDFTLGRSGAVIGWLIIGIVVRLLWKLLSNAKCDVSVGQAAAGSVFGPMIGLFANLTVVYLVLSSPGVVEAWLGFDSTWGIVLCVLALGGAVLLLLRGFKISRTWLAVWNGLFAITLVGGILALRIAFPAGPEFLAVVVRPQNALAWLLLNLMFLLSPVVLLNIRAACCSLGEKASARSLSVPVFLGITLLVLLTIMSIFTNVWGYVGPVGFVFRNQFHVPFLLAAILMIGALFLPGLPVASAPAAPNRANKTLASVTLVLVAAGLAGTWYYRPVAATGAGNHEQLTILSYNLQQGADLSGNRNWENQLALIKNINADIIGLQESDTPRASNGNVAAAKYLGARLGYHVYYGPNTVSGTYGTAILSRFPLVRPRTFFTFSEQDEIGTAVVEFEVDGKTIAFFNSHPSGKVPKKLHAAELVRQTMPYEYVIAVGDFNTTPQEEPYQIITARLKESWSEKYPDGIGVLHPSLRPKGEAWSQRSSGEASVSGDRITLADRIDHIFVSKSFRVAEAYYLPAPDSQTDHPAHWAVLTWESEEGQQGARMK